jgi:hypothetical protein
MSQLSFTLERVRHKKWHVTIQPRLDFDRVWDFEMFRTSEVDNTRSKASSNGAAEEEVANIYRITTAPSRYKNRTYHSSYLHMKPTSDLR